MKEFRTLPWGQKAIIHTDHKNVIHGNLSNDCVTWWQLLLEECNPTFVHIKGQDNVITDALSWLDKEKTLRDEDIDNQGTFMECAMSNLLKDESTHVPEAHDHLAMADFYAKKKDIKREQFPVSPRVIAEHQANDKSIKRAKSVCLPN